MARISGIDLPREKRVEIALTYIFGVGRYLSNKILHEANINPDTRVKNLSEDEVVRLREMVNKYKVEGDLRREITQNVKRLIEISAYRGMRHKRGLPSRGQRTRTNARTKRGVRKTVGGRKKKEEGKTAVAA
jgi:small subunit ribosomal protein S13